MLSLLVFVVIVFLASCGLSRLWRRWHLKKSRTFDEGELKQFLGGYLTSVHSPDFDVKVRTKLRPKPLTSVLPDNPIHLRHGVNILWSDADNMERRHAAVVKSMAKTGLKSLKQWAEGNVSVMELGLGEPEELAGVIASIKAVNGKSYYGHPKPCNSLDSSS